MSPTLCLMSRRPRTNHELTGWSVRPESARLGFDVACRRHREEPFSLARGWRCRGTLVEGARTLMAAQRVEVVPCATCETKNRVRDHASGVPRCGKCGAALPWITESDDDEFDAIVEDAAIPVL